MTKLGCAFFLATFFLCGCGANGGGSVETPDAAVTSDETEDENTAAEEEDAQEDESVRPELLVVSFGTSYNSSRSITIGGIESTMREQFPDYEVVRAFTSQIIIDKLKERDGITVMNVDEALANAGARGVKKLLIQPTHLMSGFEYMDLKEKVEQYAGSFKSVALGEPLLTSDEDYEALVSALTARMDTYDDGKTAICFMGHGTEADSNKDYVMLQEKFKNAGKDNYYVGTVEAVPSFGDVVAEVKAKGIYKKAVLVPLMVVAGDHATNDMAGDEKDSWKSMFEAEGFEVTCILEGLGQNYDVQNIYVSHAKEAEKQLAE